MNSYLNKLYYNLKPLIPRRLQISIRRRLVLRKCSLCTNIWPINEKASKLPEGWSGWPEQKRFALVLTHDVETAKGQEKCYDLISLEKQLGFRSSFNFVHKLNCFLLCHSERSEESNIYQQVTRLRFFGLRLRMTFINSVCLHAPPLAKGEGGGF